MKKIILDLSNAKIDKDRYKNCPKQLEIKKGEYNCDWDIVENNLNINELFALSDASVKGYNTNIPIGINTKSLPVGSIIKIVED